jgi:hypothetical protein
MANSKISALTAATTPLAGTEVLPIVQSSTTVKATIANVQAAPVSAGTANGVQYLNASKVPTTGSALTFDGTNFATTGTASATKFIPTGGAATGNGMYLPAANTLAWSINGVEAARLDASSNLGLGATPSAWGTGLKTISVGAAGNSIQGGTSGNYFQMNQNLYFNGTNNLYVANGYASNYQQINGQHIWSTAASGTAGNTITLTQAMTLDASSNLLVGTTTSAGRLTVDSGSGATGYININSPSSTDANQTLGFSIQDGNHGVFLLKDGAGSTINELLFKEYSGIFKWINSSTSAVPMILDTSGNLLVGTPSSTTYTGNSIIVAQGGASPGGASISVNHISGSSSGNYYLGFNYAGTGNGSITQNGTTGVLFNITSDYRLKEFVSTVTGAGERIDALNPIEFDWKSDGSRARGFFAHEFQEVYAHSVTGEKDAVNADGKPVYQAMQASTAEVVADLVAEIQSLRKRLAALEAK